MNKQAQYEPNGHSAGDAQARISKKKSEAQRRAEKQQRQIQSLAQLSQQQRQLHQQLGQNYNYDNVIADFTSKQNSYPTVSRIQSQTLFRDRDAMLLLGRKLFEETVEKLSNNGIQVSGKDRKTLELMLLGDDLVGNLREYGGKIANYIQPYIKPAVQMFAPQFAPLLDMVFAPQKTELGDVRIKRRYQLVQAEGMDANVVKTIDVNPGVRQFGQWLAVIAPAFQYYRIHKLNIQYVPSASVTTTGNISYYIELDARAPTPSAQDIAQQNKAKVHAVYRDGETTWEENELNQALKRYHVREFGTVPLDIDAFDVGRFIYASSIASSAALGTFFVDIDVSFYVPTLIGSVSQIYSFALQGTFDSSGTPLSNSPILERTGLTRVIQGQTCRAYRTLVTGTLRNFTYSTDVSNTSAIAWYVFAKSKSVDDALVNGTMEYYFETTTNGTRSTFQVGTLELQSNDLVFLCKNTNYLTPSGRVYGAYTMSPNFLKLGFSSVNSQEEDLFQRLIQRFQVQKSQPSTQPAPSQATTTTDQQRSASQAKRQRIADYDQPELISEFH